MRVRSCCRPIVFCAIAALLGCASIDLVTTAGDDGAATWETVPIVVGIPDPRDGGLPIGELPNPQVALPVERLRGRWVRFSVVVDRPSRGIGLRINASAAAGRTGSVPTVCDERPTMSQCTTSFWVPPDIDKISAVIWADREAGWIFKPRIEVATLAGAIGHRADALVGQVKANYYRTEEVDWPLMERSIAAVPAPPGDLDPTPGIAQLLRSRLPGNKHVVIWQAAMTTAPASTVVMPDCDKTPESIGIVTLPGLSAMSGDAPAAYANALHDCLMNNVDRRVWVVDLRGNKGGNMYPMIGGLAPLLPLGRLYAFTDGHRVATAEVGLDQRGVTINHDQAFEARDAGARATAPVIVVFGASCGSSCEQVANAFGARRRTLFIGQPTAGYLTGNVPFPINDDYVLLLTTGYTQDPCGRVIEDNLSPDVTIDDVDAKSIDDLLADPGVRHWLAETTRDPSATTAERCSTTTRR